MINAPNFRHEQVKYVSTCGIINNTESNNTFREMNSLSLVLELPPYSAQQLGCPRMTLNRSFEEQSQANHTVVCVLQSPSHWFNLVL